MFITPVLFKMAIFKMASITEIKLEGAKQIRNDAKSFIFCMKNKKTLPQMHKDKLMVLWASVTRWKHGRNY